MNKLIELKSISTGYNDTVILRDIHLTIREGDFLGVIGPNGGGKTTLLRLILGLLKPFSGTIQFHESTLHGTHRAIGYLPQFKIIDTDFPITVMEVVLSGLMSASSVLRRFTREQKQRAESILHTFGIHQIRHRAIGELSGGQIQRVFLCRALVSSPRLLLLDEPDTFVDSTFADSLNGILRDLNREITIILVSHDIGTVMSLVKNIACVNGTLFYHNTNEFSREMLEQCTCPIHTVSHGTIPHRTLQTHNK